MAISPYSSGVWVTWTPSGKYGEPADRALQAVAQHLRADLAQMGIPINAPGKSAAVSLTLQTLAEPDRSVSGVFAIVPRSSAADAALASRIISALDQQTGLPDRGVQPRNFYVRPGSVSVVLILGNRNNPQDLSLLTEHPALFAQAIASALTQQPEPAVVSPAPESSTVRPFPPLKPEQPAAPVLDECAESPDSEETAPMEPTDSTENEAEQNPLVPLFSDVPVRGNVADTASNSNDALAPEFCPVVNPVVKSSARAIPIVQQPAGNVDYQRFLLENTRKGCLKVMTFRGNQAFPVSQAAVTIQKTFGSPPDAYTHLFFEGKTDLNGLINSIELPAPPMGMSFSPLAPSKSALYTLTAEHPGYEPVEREIHIFENIKSIQQIEFQLAKEETD